MPDDSFIETINHLFGGAITTLIGAFTGRLMWHSGEVKLGNRRFFGKELLWEIPARPELGRSYMPPLRMGVAYYGLAHPTLAKVPTIQPNTSLRP